MTEKHFVIYMTYFSAYDPEMINTC